MTAKELRKEMAKQKEYLNLLYLIEDEIGDGIIAEEEARLEEMEDAYFNGDMAKAGNIYA